MDSHRTLKHKNRDRYRSIEMSIPMQIGRDVLPHNVTFPLLDKLLSGAFRTEWPRRCPSLFGSGRQHGQSFTAVLGRFVYWLIG